ncbi:MAG TPA: DUF1559 domain-containing protein [Urbifossiella sp.]|jgi:hypothetical protein|nr:DUF1559 domain-containing protein [Urbifossiella sp.]
MRFLRRLVLVGLATLAAAAVMPAAQPPAGGGPPVPTPPKSLTAVPRDGFLVVSVDVTRLWDHAAMKPVQDWFASQKEATFEGLIGVGPADLERVTLYLPALAFGRESGPVVLVTTRRPFNEARVLKNLLGEKAARIPSERFGNLIRLHDRGGPFGTVVLADSRTLLLLPDGGRDEGSAAALLAAQLLAGKTEGPLAPALTAAGTSALSIGIDVQQFFRTIARDPGMNEFAPYQAAFRATSATLTADLAAGGLKTRLSFTYATPDEARRAGPVLEEGLADLAKLADTELPRQADRGERGALAVVIFTAGRDLLRSAKVEVKDATVVATADGPADAAIGKLVLALPKQVAVARRNIEAQNNLKQILLAFHNYHDTYATLPGDVGPDRKTAWSWRVQILPFIEQTQIYNQLNHQLSWDHPQNKAILEKAEMPKVFEVPGRPAAKGHTYWQSFTLPKKTRPMGGRPLLVEGERGPTFASITDGTSNTFAVVEAGESVPWYAPDVLPYDGKMPLPQLGAKGGDGFLAGMVDGSVRFVPAKTDEATLRAAITRDGGEVFNFPDR